MSPNETSPGIHPEDAPHYVVEPEGTPRGELLVFFPGAGAEPGDYVAFLDYAGSLGYHTIGLSYENDESVNFVYCRFDEDPECHALVRLEIMEGVDSSPNIEVDRANSIENRLLRLLEWMEGNGFDKDWNAYHEDEFLCWERMVTAGHSQGAGHAGYAAKRHGLRRCLLFSGADWSFTERDMARWIEWPSATPASRIYFLSHLRDTTPGIGLVRQAWSGYGIDTFGPEIQVELADSFSGSHTLVTDLEPAEPENFHGATVVTRALPRGESGENLMEDTWRHMLTAERVLPGERIALMQAPWETMVSPAFEARTGWAAYQDAMRDLWVAHIDPSTGLLVRDPRHQKIDSGLSPVSESRKGPEFIRHAHGWQLVYVKGSEGMPAIWGAVLEDGKWLIERLSPEDGRPRGGCIGTQSEHWQRPLLAYWRDDGETGDLCYTFLDDPFAEEIVLGSIQAASTPVRWAADGEHVYFTQMEDGLSRLWMHAISNRRTWQPEGLPDNLVNPVVWPDDGPEQPVRVGGVVAGTSLEVYEIPDSGPAVLLWSVEAPEEATREGYVQLGSPEGLMVGGFRCVSTELARGSLGGIPEAQVWVLGRHDASGRPLAVRCDNGTPGGRRADPEFLKVADSIFVFYQQLESGSLQQVRVRSGLKALTHPDGLQVHADAEGLRLEWDDRCELRLGYTDDLDQWASHEPVRSPLRVTMDVPGENRFWRLVPALHP